MEITWIIENTLFILFVTENEMKDMADVARDCMQEGYDQKDAITFAVSDYLAGQDDCIFYNITDEVNSQIEDALNKFLTE